MKIISNKVRGRRGLCTVALFGALALLPQTTFAIAEDDCDASINVNLPYFTSDDFGAYTDDPTDPSHSCTGSPDHRTIWYWYDATYTGDLNVVTVPGGPPYGISISAHSGTCGSFTELGCNYNSFGLAHLTIPVVSGQTYAIEIATTAAAGVVNIDIHRGPYCGDGTTDSPDEECDDGNTSDTDSCTSSCTNAECGDGSLYAGYEDCDDGNADEGDGCTTSCTATCGDGIQVGIEQCDDGNTMDGDGCDSECRLPCPNSLCNCLGGAGVFAVVGESLAMKTAKSGGEIAGSQIEGSACAVTFKISAHGTEHEIGGDLFLTQGPGKTAVTFSPLRIDGVNEPGITIFDLATAGGAVKKPEYALLDNPPSTDGSNPGVAVCQQALSNVQAASTFLAGLAPTQTINEIKVDNGDVYPLNVGPGVQVIDVESIKVLTGSDMNGDDVLSTIEINLDPATEVAIVNIAAELTVEADSVIDIVGDPDRVIFNLYAPRFKLSLKPGAFVAPILLAPAKAVKLPVHGYFSNVYSAEKVTIAGGYVEGVLDCSEE